MGGSFRALNLVCQTGQKTLYFGPEKFLKKSVKNLKKVLTNVLRCGIIAKLSARDTQTTAQRTLKIKQCKTEREHTQYPLILTQNEKNPETRNCFQRYDARRQNELQTQTMISTTVWLC